ncbi:hypothetical protein DM43_2613 [Burkholderia cepacia]|uniref:Sulfotransferase domain-containing protein n=2 Tax=Burkholderiaceae TaxID=119060 RepID=A0AA89CEQ7_BURCE|nr:hypothetical protein DM43_2613 [Burkholderia cepacia]
MLREAICDEGRDVASIVSVIRSYFGGHSSAICSSELFSEFSSKNWRLLADICRGESIRLRVIFYVRNVIPFMKSVYDQLIKRHGMWEDFSVWVDTAEWLHISALKSLSEVLSDDEVTVISYEAINKRVVDSFVDLIGVAALEKQDRIVNRSLTGVERNLLRRINRKFGNSFSEEISDRMIYAEPFAKSESLEVVEEVEERLEKRHRADIDWVNSHFFGGADVVSLSGERNKAERRTFTAQASRKEQGDAVGHETRVWDLVLDWALEKIVLTQQSGASHVASALLNIDWHLASDPLIPQDFDPIAYLLNNTDVLAAGTSPYAHFITHGRYEIGRVWTAGANIGWSRAKEGFAEKTKELNDLREELDRERIKSDAECAKATLSARREVEALLRQQAERELKYAEELAHAHSRIDRERCASIETAEKMYVPLIEEYARRTSALEKRLLDAQSQLDNSRQEIELLLRQQLERSQAHAQQIARLHLSVDGERAALIDSANKRQSALAEEFERRASILESELSRMRSQFEASRGEIEVLLRRTADLERQSPHG